MALSTNATTKVTQLYVAMFGRAPDMEGLNFWGGALDAGQSVAQVAQAMFATSPARAYFPAGSSSEQVVQSFYVNVLGRQPDPEGLAFWVARLDALKGTGNPNAVGQVITEIISIVDNYQGNTPEGAASAQLFANKVQVANFWTTNGGQDAEGNAAPGGIVNSEKPIQLVTADIASVNQVKVQILTGFGDIVAGNVFTLKEAVLPGEAPVAGQKVIYWGYNPHDEHDEIEDPSGIPADGGVPVAEMLKFLTSITGLDLAELGLIDDDGVGPFDNVTSLTISNALSMNNSAENAQSSAGSGSNDNTGGQSPQLSITYADGTFREFNIEAQIADSYFDFLNNLLFDKNGNSRLYEVEVGGSSGSSDSLQPIRLTPNNNNGGTIETGFTTAGNDTIVAGRLELLHGAYIDGGAGRNVLEIEAKGTYAQPAQLLNIHEVRVHDLPNFYTTDYGSGDGYLDNTLFNGYNLPQLPDGPGRNSQDYYNVGAQTGNGDSSWIDLSRAVHIDKLVVTDAGGGSGNLAIVGVRNGATLRLEGSFLQANSTDTNVTTIQYGQGQTGTLNVELAVGDVQADINILQNASTLNIDSQGVENHMHQFFAGGSISRMNIKGAGAFAVEESLHTSFNANNPVIIDASANTGGLNIKFSQQPNQMDNPTFFSSVKVVGTATDDEIQVNGVTTASGGVAAQGRVTIEAGNGNNTVVADNNNIVKVTTGTGDDVISVAKAASATVVAGDGANLINTDGSATVNITTGTGADKISAKNGLIVTITAGDGNNNIVVDQDVALANGSGIGDDTAASANLGKGVVTITTGAGNDTISAVNNKTVTIDAGAGNNTITVSAYEVNVTTGAGNDKVTIGGLDAAFDNGDAEDTGVTSTAGDFSSGNKDNYKYDSHFVDTLAPGALLNIDLGAGTNTLTLGRDFKENSGSTDITKQFGITALEGSVISGTGIRLFVENNSDLTQADLSGATFTAVSLKQELRITDEQFTAIGADKFAVFRDEEGATEDLYLVVNSDTSLTDLLAGKALSAAVRLHVELHDGATLTVTAEQLHKHFAEGGLSGVDGLNGKLVITNAGLNFDAFNNGDSYLVVDGGSVGGGSLDLTNDVTILRSVNGFERPVPATSTDTLTLDTNVASNVDATKQIVSEVATLKIVGDADAVFTKAVDLGRDATAPLLADGVTLGDLGNGGGGSATAETDAYTIDFSALNGNVVNLTIANFQDVKQVKGNGSDTRDVRINVELAKDGQVGSAGTQNGLKSSGVQTYVVTAIGDDSVGESMNSADSAAVYVCDQSQGITTLGLRGNHDDTINFKQVNWGTNFLLETASKLKADGNPSFANVGKLVADYFWTGDEPHANAVVDIVNLDTGTIRPANAAGIKIDNADTITINANSAAVIQSVKGNSLENLVLTGPADVTVRGDLAAASVDSDEFLRTLDASGVVGTFTLELSNASTTDLSKAVVTGLDKVLFSADATLTLKVDDALAVGAANVTSATAATNSKLNFADLGSQAIDLTAFGAKNIGTVSIADDTGGVVTLDAATVLGNITKSAQSLEIKSVLNDTTVEMTVAQFNQLNGNGTVTSVNGNNDAAGTPFKSTLVLTGFGANSQVNLSDVDQSTTSSPTSKVDVVLRLHDVVASDLPSGNKFTITGDTDTKFVLEVEGNVNLAKATFAGGVDFTDVTAVKLAAGSVLTLTAAQLAQIPTTDDNQDGIYDVWTALAGAKLNIVDVDNGFAVDLNKIAAAGVDIGTLTLKNYDTATTITLASGATLGGADAIVTPTKGGLATGETTEATQLSLSAKQFNQLKDGTITGDGKVSITGLVNNSDVNGDNVIDAKDVAVINTANVSAPKGTVTLGSTVVTLDAVSSISGFEIQLANGQLIRFSTPEQAAAKITEISGNTGVQWLFVTVAAPVDTSGYGSTIGSLFIDEALLVSQPREEDLWTSLAGTIVVQKINGDTIPQLVQFNRTNTFQALTNIAQGVNYDDSAEFSTMANLTMNLEGEVNLGNILLGDTQNGNGATPNIDGKGYFKTLTINSYLDTTTIEGFTGTTVNSGIVLAKNTIGNIGLNAGSVDELISVSINTWSANGYFDQVNVSGPAALRDGLAIEVGTIKFAANATSTDTATSNNATLTLSGTNAITIGGVDISDAEVSLLDINATGYTGADAGLKIGNIVPTGGSDASNALGSFGHIYVVDGYTAPAAAFGATGNNLLVVAGGSNDFSKATALDIDQVHVTADGTLTLTAAQVAAIGFSDGSDTDIAADAWSVLAGVAVKLNIVDMGAQLLDLAKIEAAGIDIGTITMAVGTNTLNAGTTLGNADSIIVPANGVLNLTAAQFMQLEGNGTITTTGVNGTTDTRGTVNVTTLTDAEGSINLSDVTAKNGTITLSTASVVNGGTDVALTAAANLNQFSVTLDDVNSTPTPDELAGQTIRFATAAQAEREIIVINVDPVSGWVAGDPERDTNVVWMFNTITGTATPGVINTNGYDAALGRVWVNDQLVNGQNIEAIFSSPSAVQTNPTSGLLNLNNTTIVRVVNTADLATLLPENQSVSRVVEVEAFTQLPGGLVFSNPDKLVDVDNVTIALGGAVTMGGINIDDIVATSIANPGSNDFGKLTINSLLANTDTHYLLPEGWDTNTNPRPDELPAGQQVNTIGNIASGPTRGELSEVTISATGTGLNTGTITFTENNTVAANVAALTAAENTADLIVTGSQNVNIQSVNTADAEIIGLTVTTTGYTGTLTAPGASPAFQLDNTQTLTFIDADTGGTVTLGNATNAGVAGNELSFINAAGYLGTLNLGVLAQIDSTDDDLNGDGDFADMVGGVAENRAFTFTSGQGVTTATLAAANGLTPTLNAGSEWRFDYTGADAGSYLKLTSSVVLQGGSTLRLNDVPLQIEGNVDLSQLVDNAATTTKTEGLFITGGSIEVLAGATLTLTAAQAAALTVDVVGAGTVKIIGNADDLNTVGSHLKTSTVDVSGVTLTIADGGPAAGDEGLNLALTGATASAAAGALTGQAQTVVGSANADTISITSGVTANDVITGGAGDDVITLRAIGNTTVNVDAGTDTITGLNNGDVLVVSAGATATASVTAGFVATAATSNAGTVNLTTASSNDSTLNVSQVTTGTAGFNLTGGAGSTDFRETLVGSNQVDIINGGNLKQTTAGQKDILTGNGGADLFVFNVDMGNTTTLASSTTIANVDRENIQITAGTGIDGGTLTVNYTINGNAASVNVAVTAFMSPAQVAAAIANQLQTAGAFVATATAGGTDTVTVTSQAGYNIELVGIASGGTTVTTAAPTEGTDVPQEVTLTAIGNPTAGDQYSVAVTLNGGGTILAVYNALAGNTADDVLAGLAADFNLKAAPNTVNAVNAVVNDGILKFVDETPDNGGFSLATDLTAAFGGSGASNGTNYTTADIITDFVLGEDKVVFATLNDTNLQNGSGTNYLGVAVAVADAGAAVAAATTAFTANSGTLQYYFTSVTDIDGNAVADFNGDTIGNNDAYGMLFFDANLDGTADGVVLLAGVTTFSALAIEAS